MIIEKILNLYNIIHYVVVEKIVFEYQLIYCNMLLYPLQTALL